MADNEKKIKTRIINKHDIENNWLKAINFIPKSGELIIYDPDDTYEYPRVKIGDGINNVNTLPFINNVGQLTENNGEIFNDYKNNHADGNYSHSEGYSTIATGEFAHAENIKTIARGYASHAEGNMTQATGDYSHAEGIDTEAEGESAHAEGFRTSSKGNNSHAEGLNTQANGSIAHAEGSATTAQGYASHAEGCWSRAEGDCSHAEGESTKATGYASHAEGFRASSKGNHSHAEGAYTIATGRAQHVQGIYNIVDNDNIYAHIVGNGTDDNSRSNAHTLDWNGNAWFAGNVIVGTQKISLFDMYNRLLTLESRFQGFNIYDGGSIDSEIIISHIYDGGSLN